MINTKDRLLAASRQYMHNNLSGFVEGYDKAQIDALVGELEAERDAFIQFTQYLKEDHPAFADAFDETGDLIGTHEGFFGYWDDVIEACGGGSYGHSPLELIGGIRISLEEAETKLADTLARVEELEGVLQRILDENCYEPESNIGVYCNKALGIEVEELEDDM
jgi:hypothetical protein